MPEKGYDEETLSAATSSSLPVPNLRVKGNAKRVTSTPNERLLPLFNPSLSHERNSRFDILVYVWSFCRLCILMASDVLHALRDLFVRFRRTFHQRDESWVRGLGARISNEFVAPTPQRVRVICERVSSVHGRVSILFLFVCLFVCSF